VDSGNDDASIDGDDQIFASVALDERRARRKIPRPASPMTSRSSEAGSGTGLTSYAVTRGATYW
jgi:hypothetical protein